MPGTSKQDTSADNSRNPALRKAYGQASQDLREAHREEFDGFYQKRAAEAGVEWHPRPTPEQKVEEAFRRMLAEHPQVVDKVLAEGEPAEGSNV